MSVTFSIRGRAAELEAYDTYVNLSSVNCRDMFERLGVGDQDDLIGEMRARELGERCRKALASPEAEQDRGLPSYEEGRYMFVGRPAGRINMRIKELLALCETAGELGLIYWG